jgi:hypothetical protein
MRADELNADSGRASVYRIRVQGELDPSWSDWLGGLAILPQGDNSTLLVGSIVDQAALQGILNKLYAMNLTLLFVERGTPGESSKDPCRGSP